MEEFKIKGYRINITIKVPQLYENIPTYSYQFLIYNKNRELQNYPFSRIIAKTDDEFKSKLKKSFKSYFNNGVIEVYPISKLIKSLSENLA